MRSWSEPTITAWHKEMKSNVKDRMTELVRERTGPSLELKLQTEKDKKVQAMKLMEKEQRESIKMSVEKGIRKQQLYSPLKALRDAPVLSTHEKQLQRLEERKKEMAETVRSYLVQRNDLLERMRTRDPLFKMSDVKGAEAALAEQRKKKQIELETEEAKRKAHLEECQLRGIQKRESLYSLHNSLSFEERIAKAVEKKAAEMKEEEKEQRERIRDAIENGHKKQAAASPLAAALRQGIVDNSERQAEILEERKKAMSETMRKYFKERDEMVERQRTREPLFSNDGVAAGVAQLEAMAKKRKMEMQAEHQKQRQHIGELQTKALSRPMLMEGKGH
eukprot:TRINITY_DN3032_c0_g1_i1.p1 TRINITY_DN3032_c0_g1~~TRINITY_DN3032_c0_g1_i1.p1  ORF type:complete len:375 (-),score=117.60 TRINITY_DN3032_c0_g1_i1:113-1117(-)